MTWYAVLLSATGLPCVDPPPRWPPLGRRSRGVAWCGLQADTGPPCHSTSLDLKPPKCVSRTLPNFPKSITRISNSLSAASLVLYNSLPVSQAAFLGTGCTLIQRFALQRGHMSAQRKSFPLRRTYASACSRGGLSTGCQTAWAPVRTALTLLGMPLTHNSSNLLDRLLSILTASELPSAACPCVPLPVSKVKHKLSCIPYTEGLQTCAFG
jgi:hypothetical protein